jgi:N-acetylmuramoyl-L-alanine amidase
MGVWDKADLNPPGSSGSAPTWSWRRGRSRPEPAAPPQPEPPVETPDVPDWTWQKPRRNAARTARPVPKMPKTRQDGRVRSPALTLAGALLIIGLTVLAFAGGRLFGRVPEPTPVPETPVIASIVELTPEVVVEAPVENAPPVVPEEQTPIPLPANFTRPPIVCLDPGHGGSDRGFTEFFEAGGYELEEANLVMQQAWDLEARLKNRGYEVVLTRNTDIDANPEGKDVNKDGRTAAHDAPRSSRNKTLDEIQARINICNEAKADLLVSIHINGYSTEKPRGYETWFTRERPFGDRNAEFATLAYAHLKEQLARIGYVLPPEEERGVLPDTAADVQMEHQVFEHFVITGPEIPGVIKPSEMPGAIVESFFLSNPGDVAVMTSPEGKNAIVTAFEQAIVEYFEYHPPGT